MEQSDPSHTNCMMHPIDLHNQLTHLLVRVDALHSAAQPLQGLPRLPHGEPNAPQR